MLAGADILGLAALALAAAVDAGAGASPGARTPVPFSLTPPSPPGRGRGAGGAQFPLEPVAGGGYRYQGPRFVATIAPDGVVSFVDRKQSAGGLQFALTPVPLPPGTPSLESSFRDSLTGRKRPEAHARGQPARSRAPRRRRSSTATRAGARSATRTTCCRWWSPTWAPTCWRNTWA